MDAYRRRIYDMVIVKRTKVRVRNGEARMWALVAKRDIPAATFVAFYTGDMASRSCPHGSHYALDVGPHQPCIVPFPDEAKIRPVERDAHPLASMNEPGKGESANCHMAVQDFGADEVEGADGEAVRFFRGMACFTCQTVGAGEALTWYYGAAYQAIRDVVGYEAGGVCKRVEDGEVFIKKDSESVLEALPRVPRYCVYPVLNSQTVKSARFKAKRKGRKRADSEGEVSESESSGSGQAEAYVPRPRRERRRET